jgi:hypothetical protein
MNHTLPSDAAYSIGASCNFAATRSEYAYTPCTLVLSHLAAIALHE